MPGRHREGPVAAAGKTGFCLPASAGRLDDRRGVPTGRHLQSLCGRRVRSARILGENRSRRRTRSQRRSAHHRVGRWRSSARPSRVEHKGPEQAVLTVWSVSTPSTDRCTQPRESPIVGRRTQHTLQQQGQPPVKRLAPVPPAQARRPRLQQGADDRHLVEREAEPVPLQRCRASQLSRPCAYTAARRCR